MKLNLYGAFLTTARLNVTTVQQMKKYTNGRFWRMLLLGVASVWLAGCGPPGAHDLRKGEQMMEEGRYAEAIPPLRDAAQKLSAAPPRIQACALNLLGTAYAGMGQLDKASQAYDQALRMDRNNVTLYYNIGCVRVAQGDYNGAIDRLNSYVAVRPKDGAGYLQLGEAWFNQALENSGTQRARRLDNARRVLEMSERLRGTAQAANLLGLIDVMRHNGGAPDASAAVAQFRQAIARDHHFAPALLNLAIVEQEYLNDPRAALETYHAFLALNPGAPQAAAVSKVAHDLDLAVRITLGRPPRLQPPASSPPRTNVPTAFEGAAPERAPARPTEEPAPSRIVHAPVVRAPEPSPKAAPETVFSEQPAAPAPAPSPPLAVALKSPAPPASPPDRAPETAAPDDETAPPPPPSVLPPKKSFTEKINPLHWFGRKSPDTEASGPHYQYPLPETFLPGNRQEAEKWAGQAVEARRQQRWTEAVDDLHQAIQADPTYFQARLLLGLTEIDTRDYPSALTALDGALQLQPASADARYPFAWTLEKSGYYEDALHELEKLLANHPDDVRGRLLLGNLYAEHYGEPKLARAQYEQALELDPHNHRADALREWLVRHP